MSNRVDLKEFVAGFVIEADEHLHSVNRNLIAVTEALKEGKSHPRAVGELFRSLHTIKGLASMIGAEPIVDLSHEMEGILRIADRSGERLSERALDLLVEGTRAIEERVQIVAKSGITEVPKAPSRLVEALALEQNAPKAQQQSGAAIELSFPSEIIGSLSPANREQATQAAQAGERVVLLEFQPSPEKVAKGYTITSVRERLAKLGDLVKVIPRSSVGAPTGIAFSLLITTRVDDAALIEAAGCTKDSIQELKGSEAAEAALGAAGPVALENPASQVASAEPDAQPEWAPSDHSSIRVDVRRLDDALERLSDLVVTRSKLARVAADLKEKGVDTRELSAVLAENTRQLRRLRAAITDARMVPLATLLQRLPLIVRGLTKDTDKSVNVTIQAGSAEVDKAVADKIFPAIIHLVRNAVDHAIESRRERREVGKPEIAEFTVVCDDTLGTSLIMTISDDGRGIDREKIAEKAGRAIAKNDVELLEQISTPGLSTRDAVTHVSGRGLGMDIVKRTIETLGGTLSLSTHPGQGTTFTLRVPVNITIVDVLCFAASGQIFAAPVAAVDEIVEVDAASAVQAPVPSREGPQPRLIQRRSRAIPLLRLDELLNKGGEAGAPPLPKALVVNQAGGAIAFGVDRMLGQQEVVVRPLDDKLVRVSGVAGATDLGDGRPTLVLDLMSLGTAFTNNTTVNP